MYWSAFHYYNKIPEITKDGEKGFILAYDLRGFSHGQLIILLLVLWWNSHHREEDLAEKSAYGSWEAKNEIEVVGVPQSLSRA
jgi:hypothetical protein